MANVPRLELMVKMLREVAAGTWRSAKVQVLEVDPSQDDPDDLIPAEEMPDLKSRFNIAFWLNTDGSARDCGYSACAVGHACLDQRFIDQGLHFVQASDAPYCAGWFGFDAVSYFFEIPQATAEDLFLSSGYLDDPWTPHADRVTPGMVADKIELYLSTL